MHNEFGHQEGRIRHQPWGPTERRKEAPWDVRGLSARWPPCSVREAFTTGVPLQPSVPS